MTCLPELPKPYEMLVSSASDGTVKVWDLENNRAVFTYQLASPVSCLAGSGTKVVCGCVDGSGFCIDAEIHDEVNVRVILKS